MMYWVVKNLRIIGKFNEEEASEFVREDEDGDVEIIPEFDSDGKPTRIAH